MLDATQIPQIGKDLEDRNKRLTLNQLKKQGELYREFNNRIVGVLDEDAAHTKPILETLFASELKDGVEAA